MNRANDDNLESKVTELEKILSILSIENCVFILANLTINGPMNYENLSQETKLGKATIFRNLDLLLKAEFISKTKNESIRDKRKSTFYYRSEGEIRIPLINQELVKYLDKKNKTNLLEDINRHQNSISDALVKAMSFRKKKIENGIKGKSLAITVLFEDFKPEIVEKRTLEFIKEINKEINQGERDYTKAMKKPGLLRINFIQ